MKTKILWSAASAIVLALLAVISTYGSPAKATAAPTPSCGPMDVAFVFDTTGSMGGALTNVAAATPSLIAQISAASGGDYQLALVTFKNDVVVNNDLAASNDAAIQTNIAGLTASGGSADPEASDEALNTVINGLDAADRLPGQQTGDFDGVFRPGAVKIIVLVTDAPPAGFDDMYTVGVDDVNAHTRATEAAANGMKIAAVFVPTGGDYAGQAAIMADYGSTTGGSFITTAADGTGTDQAIADVIAGCGHTGGCPETPISPANVEAVVFPGASTDIAKCVDTPNVPPKPDIYFLSDTTGSMDPSISNVQTNAAGILGLISTAAPNAEFGGGDYKDFPESACDPDPYAFNNGASIGTDDGIGGTADASDAIAAWSAGGGCDPAEAQLFALHQIATDPSIGFRTDSSRIIVWFGDCPGHDPIPTSLSGLGSDLTEASVTAELQAANIKVVAISVTTGCIDGLDGDPQALFNGYPVAEAGTAGQATRIAAATGGAALADVSPADVATAILEGIGAVSVDVAMHSDCSAPITTTFSPSSQTVESGTSATFTETISVATNAPGGTYECDDYATIDGQPLLDAAGAVAHEHKVLHVPEGFLTGGGQIATGRGTGADVISFGGNVGFLADFSLVGQWETNFHNVGGTAFDNGKFHSTSITSLQFYKDAGAGPGNPPANANVGSFTAIGRLNGEDGWTLSVCLADRGEPGKNDSIRVQLYRPDATLAYDSHSDFPSQDNTLTGVCANRTKLKGGNFQIHSGLKN